MPESGSPHDYQIKTVDCPTCDNDDAKLVSHLLDIPFYKDFMMLNLNCRQCGYRSSDFYNLDSKGYTRYEYLVDSSTDDTTKIVRAKGGIVNIPELGIKIEPVNEPVSWIRNVEGVLRDMRKKLILLVNDPENATMKKHAIERLELLDEMLNYQIPFTLIVEDPDGNSLILPAVKDKLLTSYTPVE
jgi:zinc finger protein